MGVKQDMGDLAAVGAALGTVQDPELHLPLDQAGMVGDLQVDRSGTVKVTVRLTTPSCPMKDTLFRDVSAAVKHARRAVGECPALALMLSRRRG